MSETRTAPPCAVECKQVLLDGFTKLGVDVNVSWAPPLFPTGYEPLDLVCPHGVHWFAEPTTEQRMQWAAEGVA